MGSRTLFYIHVNGGAVCEAEVLVLQDGGLKAGAYTRPLLSST
jgi:acetyl-CoA carboxylase/biotin carboxylase 1